MKSPWGFLRKNHWKKETLLAYYYAAKFEIQLKLVPAGRLCRRWGREDAESPWEESFETYRRAAWISRIVNKVCDKTPWESKCLVRALTARSLLHKRRIASTLYLGCGMEDGKMVAHAWLRCGEIYVTGGDGGNYTTVARFCTEPERRTQCLPSGES